MGNSPKVIRYGLLERPVLNGVFVGRAKLFRRTHEEDVRRLDEWTQLCQLAREFPTYLYEAPSGKWFVVRFQGGRMENSMRRIPGVRFLVGPPINSGVTRRARLLDAAGIDVEEPVAELRGRRVARKKIHVTAYVGETEFPYIKNTLTSFLSGRNGASEREKAIRAAARFMAQAHQKGVVHNDLYSRNVLYFPNQQRIVYIDPETWQRRRRWSPFLKRDARRELETFLRELQAIEKEFHASDAQRLLGAFKETYRAEGGIIKLG